jgi:drug/metabolite transporter (DMT)-like permease
VPLDDEPAPVDQRAGRTIGILLVLGAALFWSASGIAVKWADVDPIAFSTLRGLGAVVAMLPLLGIGARLTGRARPGARLMVANAVLHMVMITSFICAMTYATAAEGIFLQYSAPAWAALYAWALLGRRIDRVTTLALAVAMTGILLILGMDRSGGLGGGDWLGPMLGVLAGVSYGGVILTLDLIDVDARRRTGTTVNIFFVVLIANGVTSLVLLPWALARGMMSIPAHLMGAIILIGVVQMATPYVLFQLGLRRIGPVAAGLIALIEPILNPIWVWLGVGEVPPRSIYFGGTLILLAVVITAVFGRKRGVETRQGTAADLAMPSQ